MSPGDRNGADDLTDLLTASAQGAQGTRVLCSRASTSDAHVDSPVTGCAWIALGLAARTKIPVYVGVHCWTLVAPSQRLPGSSGDGVW